MTVPRFQLHDPDLLRTLMRRTGDGTRTSVRDLAKVAGVHASHVGELLTGHQKTATGEVAAAISGRIGVDLLVLWTPAERTANAVEQEVSV
ncbi:XRE family transcriptional regulator [Streptomyces tateyamensis]|uniref:XRE family transcriptional regulator n=1 Tax=Streptomyces tateyamensis TaxID=565073 RepID=UPI001FEA71FC|nr:XRE family transcriptional regulator [Streptomyces tateyamensis]